MTDKLTIDDLLVRVDPFRLDDGRTVVSRPMTESDLVEVIRSLTPQELASLVESLGGEVVRRCIRHGADAWEPGDYCRQAWPDDIDDCVMGRYVILPILEGSEE